jgi:hypothetical protein
LLEGRSGHRGWFQNGNFSVTTKSVLCWRGSWSMVRKWGPRLAQPYACPPNPAPSWRPCPQVPDNHNQLVTRNVTQCQFGSWNIVQYR